MSDNVIDDTFVDRPATGAGVDDPFNGQTPTPPAPPAPPSPANMPRPPAPEPQNQPGDGGQPDKGKGKKLETYEEAMAELEKVRKESAARRVKLNELEPLAQAAKDAEEAQKTELQREREAREAAEARAENADRVDVAYRLGVDPENIDLIGSGSREEMETRAARVVAMQQAKAGTYAPPSDRPVEGLRPGASPEPPKPADDSYPETWKPNHIRDQESAQYGQ